MTRWGRLLTARAVAMPEPDLPPVHVPDFKLYDDDANTVWCKRCERMIDVHTWAKVCPGPKAAAS